MHAAFDDTIKYRVTLYEVPLYDRTSLFYTANEMPMSDIQRQLNLSRRNGRYPDLVVLYGDYIAHTAARMDDPLVHDQPLICMAVTDPDYKGLLERRHNATVLEHVPGIKENMDFIRSLGFPTWIVTGLDNGYVDDHIRQVAIDQMRRDASHYNPNINLENPSTYLPAEQRDTTRLTLIPLSLQDYDRNWKDEAHTIGFDFLSMLQPENEQFAFLRLKNDLYSDMALNHRIGHYFSATPERFDLPLPGVLNACLGGYFSPFPIMAREVKQIADQILLDNIEPHDIVWRQHERGYWLDWRQACHIHPYASDFDSRIQFVNLPWKYRSPTHLRIYHLWIPLLGGLFVLAIIAIIGYLYFDFERQTRSLYAAGEEAAQAQLIVEEISVANHSFFFRISPDEKIHIQEGFFRHLGWRHRPISLSVAIRCLDETDRRALRLAIGQGKTRERRYLELTLRLPTTHINHLLIIHLTHLPGIDGQLPQIVGMFWAAENASQARQVREEAMRLSEESTLKESFLASMGHEIRNPLNAIMGFSRLLMEQRSILSDEERAEYSHYIMQSNEQLLSLLNGVFEHSAEKDLNLELSVKSVKDLMNELYMIHTVVVPQQLSFSFEEDDEDVQVECNRSALLQIVSNLMNNAIKFTSKGRITLGWERIGDWVTIYVEDSGLGIPDDFLPKIFEKFYKVDAHSMGAGIGLPLCKRLVENMGGEIKVESIVGVGSCFKVLLPVYKG